MDEHGAIQIPVETLETCLQARNDIVLEPFQPKVSVMMITYNHEKFIAQAIEGVLRQKTAFPIELVIGEDCSTDRTREIVLAFQNRHPDIIRALTPQTNLGMGRNCVETIKACRGEYIAICEGDDYWTDPEKLAKQAALLDAHPEHVLCFHRVTAFEDATSEEKYDYPPPDNRKPICTHEELITFNCIQTCSAMFRRGAVPDFGEEFLNLKMGDFPLFILLTRHGSAAYLDDNMARYRLHVHGAWSSASMGSRALEALRMRKYVQRFLSGAARQRNSDIIGKASFSWLGRFLKRGEISNATKVAWEAFWWGCRSGRIWQKLSAWPHSLRLYVPRVNGVSRNSSESDPRRRPGSL